MVNHKERPKCLIFCILKAKNELIDTSPPDYRKPLLRLGGLHAGKRRKCVHYRLNISLPVERKSQSNYGYHLEYVHLGGLTRRYIR